MTKKQGSAPQSAKQAQASAAVVAQGSQDPDSQSVAGEEDPGASLDMADDSASNPASATVLSPSTTVNPGDEAPAGTPGTGESICRECGGSGRLDNAPCPSCGGTGKVIVGVGGA